MKRALDFTVSATALILLSPLLALIATATWLQDRRSPFYVAPRAARGGGAFKMVKFRSMTVGADRTGVDSTSTADARITPLGHVLRCYKLDELPQLWNVLWGEMSLVGPRPQVLREVALYTELERGLLDVAPGITDLASIVFADEGEILAPYPDPDLAYHQLIRPWKSRLGLLYARHASISIDVQILILTIVALLSRRRALDGITAILDKLGADAETRQIAARSGPLTPSIPPGSSAIVAHR